MATVNLYRYSDLFKRHSITGAELTTITDERLRVSLCSALVPPSSSSLPPSLPHSYECRVCMKLGLTFLLTIIRRLMCYNVPDFLSQMSNTNGAHRCHAMHVAVYVIRLITLLWFTF